MAHAPNCDCDICADEKAWRRQEEEITTLREQLAAAEAKAEKAELSRIDAVDWLRDAVKSRDAETARAEAAEKRAEEAEREHALDLNRLDGWRLKAGEAQSRIAELEGALRKCAEIAECVWKHGGAHTIDVLIGKDDRTHVVQGDALKEIRYVARTLLARPGGEERKPSLTDDCGKCQRLRLNCECPEGPTDVWLCWSESKGWHNSTTPGEKEGR